MNRYTNSARAIRLTIIVSIEALEFSAPMRVEFAGGEEQRDDRNENEIVHDETLPPYSSRA